jgi:succinate dehydrogenase assembly factor 2
MQLLDQPDWEIYYWATEEKATPEQWQKSGVLKSLKEHIKNKAKEIRRMPDLY